MKAADLSPDCVAKLKPIRFDRFVEKHEGPFDWDMVFRYYDPEFMEILEQPFLLPIERSQHENITILWAFRSEDGNYLTVFLKDRTFYKEPIFDELYVGYFAICKRVDDFYLAIVYHEWYVTEL